MSSVFANGLGDQGSIPSQVIPETQKMVLDATFLSTQHYKLRIKGSGAIQGMDYCPPLLLGGVAIEMGAFQSPLTKVANLYIYIYIYIYIDIYVIEISGKVNKLNTYNWFSRNILFFIQERNPL